jgi:hypothetical protein
MEAPSAPSSRPGDSAFGKRGSLSGALPVVCGALLMVAFVAATNPWLGWKEGIEFIFHMDIYRYEQIAAAAPGAPADQIGSAWTEKAAAPWLAGALGDVLGVSYRDVFRAFVGIVGIGTVLAVSRICVRLQLSVPATLLCLSLLILSPYTFRPYLLGPGAAQDLVFVLGLALLLWGLAGGRLRIVLLGGAVAILGRQTALLVAAAAVPWLWVGTGWRERRPIERLLSSAALLALVAGIFLGVKRAVSSFTFSFAPRIPEDTILPWLGQPGTIEDLYVHLRGIALPLIVVGACILGTVATLRRTGAPRLPVEFWCALLIAGAIVVQPLLISPSGSWPGLRGNEERLSALALAPLCVALAYAVRQAERKVRWVGAPWWLMNSAVVALLLASHNFSYSRLVPDDTAVEHGVLITTALQMLAGGLLGWLLASRYGPALRQQAPARR